MVARLTRVASRYFATAISASTQVVPEPTHRAEPMIVIEVGAPDVEWVVRIDVISGVAIAMPEPASNRPKILQRPRATRN